MMQCVDAKDRQKRGLGKLSGKLSFKSLGSFKKLKKMLKFASSGLMASSIIDEIGSVSHDKTWSHSYFDHKFQLIGANMNLMAGQVNAIQQYMDAVDSRISSNRLTNIITSFVAFLGIVCLIGGTIYLFRKTTSSHFQKKT